MLMLSKVEILIKSCIRYELMKIEMKHTCVNAVSAVRIEK